MDHERVNIDHLSISCGVQGLSRIGEDIDDVLYSIASRLYHPSRGNPCGAFVFSNLAEQETNADRLLKRADELGFVANSESSDGQAFENPKTGNFIRVYVWVIDHLKFKIWYGVQRVNRLKKVGAS